MKIKRISSTPTTGTTIGKVFGVSITALIESLRWAIMILPVILSIPQLVHAAEPYTITEISTYETIDDGIDPPLASKAIARFGPFAVTNATTAELVDGTDSDSHNAFRAMLAAYPQIRTINMVECPGTLDDEVNLAIARAIRAKGINTHVPAGGSIRSGGVELFLAGVKRTADRGAEFGVHSWQDYDGHEAKDVAADDPVHADYINYYKAMGLAPDIARAFYAFTNAAAPANGVYYMTSAELARFTIIN
ncbi:MAG: hypothetical protein ACKVOJ_00175 [Sphingomonadaceae bacterium]